MVFSVLYLVVRALFGLLVRSRRGPDVKDIELLVLRHEVEVLRRQVRRPRFRRADRALFAAAACHLPCSSRLTLLVTPRTLLRWHQALARWKWRRYASKRPGRPGLDAETRELVLRLARENPERGYQRIRGELAKVGVVASTTSIRRLLARAGLGPAPRSEGPTWHAFLPAQATGIVACAWGAETRSCCKRAVSVGVTELMHPTGRESGPGVVPAPGSFPRAGDRDRAREGAAVAATVNEGDVESGFAFRDGCRNDEG
jgi:hypothetical protein